MISDNQLTCKECSHNLEPLMSYCPNCGKQKLWTFRESALSCPSCESSLNKNFNYCFVCDEDVYPEGQREPKTRAAGFRLEHDCSRGCGGRVQEFMTYCPWCGEKQKWSNFYDSGSCPNCKVSLENNWYYCVFCGKLIDKENPQSWARKGGYLRPFNALAKMPNEHRENLRKSLSFKWSKASLADTNYQAKEILDCNLKGVIARLHRTEENLFKIGSNITWREILQRCLDESNIRFPAHLSEYELEDRLLTGLLKNKIPDIKSEVRKAFDLKKLNELVVQNPDVMINLLLPLLTAQNIFNIIESVSTPQKNAVALSAVLSICLWLHPSYIDMSTP